MKSPCIQIIEVTTQTQLEEFIHLPQLFYGKDPKWSDIDEQLEIDRFRPEKNPGLRVMKVQPFIARKMGKPVGRICGVIFEPFNQRWQKRVAFFGFFESIYSQAVADRLFEAVREWAIKNEMNELWGPINFNIEGEVGILIEGHHHPSTTGLPHNPDYYHDLCQGYGLIKEKDMFELYCSVNLLYARTRNFIQDCQHLVDDPNYQIVTLDARSSSEYLRKLALVYNQSFYNHWGFGQISEDYFCLLIEEMDHLLPEELFLIAEYQGEPIGFCYCNLDQNPKKIRANTMGIIPQFRRHKIASWFYYEWAMKMKKMDFQEVSVSWAVEDSLTIDVLRKINPKITKKFRVFRKELI